MDDNSRDIELLSRIDAGDDGAMSDFYLAYEARIYAFALKKLNDSQAAADIVHEVMMAVWQTAGRFQGRAKVSSWLFGIAHNKIVDAIRKQSRHAAAELDEETIDEGSDEALDLVSMAQDKAAIARCLERLSGAHAEVVHLAFFEDMSYPEIASALGCPEGTVKTRMHHARKQLKRCLQKSIEAFD